MSNTVTFRVSKELAAWLQRKAARTGISQCQIIREQLERIRRSGKGSKKFMRLAGSIRGGPSDISTRKGYSTG
jgi:hypothetical protein